MATALKHGFWLMAFLVVALLLTLVDIPFDFTVLSAQDDTPWARWLLLALDLVQLCGLLAILFWSRLGVILYGLASLPLPVLMLVQGRSVNIANFVAILILLVLIRSRWGQMPWGLSIAIK